MQKSRVRLAILMAWGVALLAGCNTSKLFHTTDDKQITTDIQAKLFSDPVLKTRDIRVESRNGTVTVSGTVGTELEKVAVGRIATQEDGVKNVANLLSVESGSAAPVPEVPPIAENEVPPAPPPPGSNAPEKPVTEKARRTHRAQAPKDDDEASSGFRPFTREAAANAESDTAAAPPSPPSAAQPSTPPAPAPVAAAPASPAPAPPPAPKPQEHLTVPAGSVVTVRMVDSIDSSTNRAGEEFAASLDSPIVVGDRVVAPRGADARVRLVDAQTAGRMTGRSELQLELISVAFNGVPYVTHSSYCEQHGASRGTRTAETVGGGAVLGALIGGILGHGKGAAIGSIAGAGAGTAVQVSTKGQQVKIPAETKLDFTLKDPVTVTLGENN